MDLPPGATKGSNQGGETVTLVPSELPVVAIGTVEEDHLFLDDSTFITALEECHGRTDALDIR